mgnify:CR=1 FL=1
MFVIIIMVTTTAPELPTTITYQEFKNKIVSFASPSVSPNDLRNILDELKDPIIHIIRNCIDHGIETTEDRLNAGKEQTASLEINLEPIGSGKVSIEVKDDGRGIDIEKVKSSALAKRLVREETLKSMILDFELFIY